MSEREEEELVSPVQKNCCCLRRSCECACLARDAYLAVVVLQGRVNEFVLVLRDLDRRSGEVVRQLLVHLLVDLIGAVEVSREGRNERQEVVEKVVRVIAVKREPGVGSW